MTQGIFCRHDEAALNDLGGGTARRVLAWNAALMAVEVSFERGAVGAAHTHPHTQCSYVLSGRFRYTVEGESVDMAPGDSIIVPAGAVHGTECLAQGVLLDVFTPAREDFVSQA